MLLGTVATKDRALAKAAAEGTKHQDRALAAEREQVQACCPVVLPPCCSVTSVSLLGSCQSLD